MLIAVVFAVLVWIFGWDWTGFTGEFDKITTTRTSNGATTAAERLPGRTFLDWLQLLGVLAIPVVVGFGTVWFTTKQGQVSNEENKDNQGEALLQGYIDKMSELLLEKKLHESQPEDGLWDMAPMCVVCQEGKTSAVWRKRAGGSSSILGAVSARSGS